MKKFQKLFFPILEKYTIFALILLFIFLYSLLSIIKYEHFLTGLDLAIYVQTMWFYTHFKLPYVTFFPTYGDLVWADHFTPSLSLLAPIYAIFPTPKTLLIVQAILFAIGAYPIYLFAKEVLKNTLLALTFAFVYLTSFAGQFPVTFDFHAATFSASFLPWVFYFMFKRRWVLLIIFCLIAIGGKEDAPFYIAGVGLYLMVVKRSLKIGALISVFASIYFFIVTRLYMPSLQHIGTHLYNFNYFSLKPSYLLWVFTSPPDKLLTMFLVFSNNLFLILLSGPFLIFPFIHFFINFANPAFPSHWSIILHYRSYADSIMAFGSILGYAFLMKFRPRIFDKRNIKILVAALLFANALFLDMRIHLPLNSLAKKITYQNESWMDDDKYVISKIPKDGVLLTSNLLASQTAFRQYSYFFPLHLDQADYIVADTRPNQPDINIWLSEDTSVRYAALIKSLATGKKYTVIARRGNAVLLKRKWDYQKIRKKSPFCNRCKV